MFTNYIKLAIRVLGRNKFFTAITLFGISFTLAILMLIISMMETEVGSTQPLTKKDKIIILPNLSLKKQFYDTIYTFDTLLINEVVTIDSTYKLEKAGSNNSNSSFAWSYLDKHLSNLESPKSFTFFSSGNSFNAYVNNAKVEMKAVYTDHRFWEIFDFNFRDGFGFGESSVEQQEKVAVITTKLAENYFGRTTDVLNEYIEMDGTSFKVMGVVDPPGVSLLATDIIVPHTLLNNVGRSEEIGFGGFMAIFLAESTSDMQKIKDEIAVVNAGLEVHPDVQEYYNEVRITPLSYFEIYADNILDLDTDEVRGRSLSTLRWIMIGLLSFFILLPTLNLINLNVSRIMERSSEIGVRKAFGATRSNILGQFIVENIVQTILGGILGMGLAMIMIKMINDAGLLGDIVLKINYRFYIYSLIICLLFGLLSGLLPAYRMSKLHVVNALKQTKS